MNVLQIVNNFRDTTFAATREFDRKVQEGEIILPEDLPDAGEEKATWPNSIIYGGKFIRINYNTETNIITLAGSE